MKSKVFFTVVVLGAFAFNGVRNEVQENNELNTLASERVAHENKERNTLASETVAKIEALHTSDNQCCIALQGQGLDSTVFGKLLCSTLCGNRGTKPSSTCRIGGRLTSRNFAKKSIFVPASPWRKCRK